MQACSSDCILLGIIEYVAVELVVSDI